jgi:nitronate monooxygenase
MREVVTNMNQRKTGFQPRVADTPEERSRRASGRLPDLLGCRFPIQLAPMSSVSITPALPLAVAMADGHAVYPANALAPPALDLVIGVLAAHTQAFGVNFIVPLMKPDSLELAAATAPYIDFFLAAPDASLVERAHAGGAVCGWQVESASEARAAVDAGCDVVIAKSWESGGLKRTEGLALIPLLDAVLDVVSVPVIAAGGIATSRGVAAVLAAGAQCARVGTRFIAAQESDAQPFWARTLIAAPSEAAIMDAARGIGSPEWNLLQRTVDVIDDGRQMCPTLVSPTNTEFNTEFQAHRPLSRVTLSSGTAETLRLYAGQSVGAVHDVRSAAEIMAELASRIPGRRLTLLP